ncbi:hypothetical protein [Protaetiibacter mangrovi]|uniref:Uncharacterized protein n=1 Tax=Protaetiibacter mangrovi TaxID=2970926 RepID=A0ABT1ZI50_9MICO|nr:hypothetical protein [Protaetiibacter mangrovi]MCS0500376.1 hypothetical protein [Protaetiibacter mangrovi]
MGNVATEIRAEQVDTEGVVAEILNEHARDRARLRATLGLMMSLGALAAIWAVAVFVIR